MSKKINNFTYETSVGCNYTSEVRKIKSGKIVDYSEGYLLINDWEHGGYYFEHIDTHVRIGPFITATKFQEGFALVSKEISQICSDSEWAWCFIDYSGTETFGDFETKVSNFSCGYSKISSTKFMNKSGKIFDYRKKDPLATFVSEFKNGVASVERLFNKKKKYFIDTEFKRTTDVIDAHFNELSESFKIKDPDYKFFSNFKNGYAEIGKTYKSAILTEDGEIYELNTPIQIIDDYLILNEKYYIKINDLIRKLTDEENKGYNIKIYYKDVEVSIKHFQTLDDAKEYTYLLDNKIIELMSIDNDSEHSLMEEEFLTQINENKFIGPKPQVLTRTKK